jgi:hypothetical protein
MDKDTPTKVKEIRGKWYSVGYTPRFIRCPNCDWDIHKTWEKPNECKKCGQKLLWN